jgi:hypothetical protein
VFEGQIDNNKKKKQDSRILNVCNLKKALSDAEQS